METAYTERDNMNMPDFIHEQITKLYNHETKSEYLLSRAVDTISMEVFQSLHFIGMRVMEIME